MALKKGDLISKLLFVQAFNEAVWGSINTASGGRIYHGGSSAVKTSEGVSLQAYPRFSATSYVASNGGTGTVKDTNPTAVPLVHLQTVTNGARMYYQLVVSDLKVTDKAVKATDLYSACMSVVNALVHIRPFNSRWRHESNTASKVIDITFGASYAVYIDNPTAKNGSIPQSGNKVGSGTWGAGGSLAYWSINKGSNLGQVQEQHVARGTVVMGQTETATGINALINNFYTAWKDRCLNVNTFDYTYFSCHHNCHSNCHSSCHGSRSRR